MEKKLTKSLSDKKIAGVCSGIAKYFNLDPTLVRVIWLVLALCFGVGIVAYLVCWLLLPNA